MDAARRLNKLERKASGGTTVIVYANRSMQDGIQTDLIRAVRMLLSGAAMEIARQIQPAEEERRMDYVARCIRQWLAEGDSAQLPDPEYRFAPLPVLWVFTADEEKRMSKIPCTCFPLNANYLDERSCNLLEGLKRFLSADCMSIKLDTGDDILKEIQDRLGREET